MLDNYHVMWIFSLKLYLSIGIDCIPNIIMIWCKVCMKYILRYMKVIRKLVVVSQSRYYISLKDCCISDISWDDICIWVYSSRVIRIRIKRSAAFSQSERAKEGERAGMSPIGRDMWHTGTSFVWSRVSVFFWLSQRAVHEEKRKTQGNSERCMPRDSGLVSVYVCTCVPRVCVCVLACELTKN